MPKLFLRIRQKLLSENRFSKYLFYAIGEIVLVVIGILIALQINNWNEDRKTRVVEIQMLKNIKSSLQADIENQIKPNLKQLELDLKNIADIKGFIASNNTYNDSMNTKFNTLMYSKNIDFEITSYKALENEGLQIIENARVKEGILRLYNISYPNLQYVIANFMNNLTNFFRPNMRGLFIFLDDNRQRGYVPVDYSQLRADRDFRNNLIVSTENCQNLYQDTKKLHYEILSLIDLIDTELNRRD